MSNLSRSSRWRLEKKVSRSKYAGSELLDDDELMDVDDHLLRKSGLNIINDSESINHMCKRSKNEGSTQNILKGSSSSHQQEFSPIQDREMNNHPKEVHTPTEKVEINFEETILPYFDSDFQSECNRLAADLEGNSSSTVVDNEDPPLYEGCQLTVKSSLILILTAAMVHNLNGECLADILLIISLHCLNPNYCTKTLHHLSKIFSGIKAPLKFHYFCSDCFSELKSKNDKCPVSEIHEKGVSFFIEIPIIWQIRKIFSRQGMYEKLKYRFEREKKEPGNIEDIYDGSVYKKYMGEKGFLTNKNNISLMWYSDGVPVFKSTKLSLWPFYLAINELPYKHRLKKQNLLIGGLWYGVKPHPNAFMKLLVPSFTKCLEGFQVSVTEEKVVNMKAILLCGTCDSPARCMFTGMVQYNGYFGCHFCKIPGEWQDTVVYPYKEDKIYDDRNHDEIEKLASKIVADVDDDKNKNKNKNKSSCEGVREPSVLSKIIPDLINGMGIDVMHCVFEGVMKKLLDLWFSSEHRDKPFSLHKIIDTVDQKLTNICPPNFIKRSTRGIKDYQKFWKASEYKNFMLYYSIPVLFGLLPINYMQNYMDLVFVVFTLSKSSISEEDIKNCEIRIRRFLVIFQTLYSNRYMTSNFHQLLHLPQVVKNLGPLWVYSCFPFEDFNGQILKLVHGTRYAEQQIASKFFMAWSLDCEVEKLKCETVKQFCTSCIERKPRIKILQEIGPNTFSIGTYKRLSNIIGVLRTVLLSENFNVEKCWLFERLFLRNRLYTTLTYCVELKTTSSYVYFQHQNKKKFGVIKNFVKISDCNCKHKCFCLPAKFLAVINVGKLSTFVSAESRSVPHIRQFSLTDEHILVNVQNLGSLLILASDKHICEPANTLEVE